MNKVLIFLFAALVLVAGGYSLYRWQQQPATELPTLTVYAYDSLTAEWGLLPQIITSFETSHNAHIRLVNFADTGAILQQLIAEKNNPQADVVLGLDNVDFPTAKAQNLFQPYRPIRSSDLPAELRFDDDFTMTPFDYGFVGFVYDTKALSFNEPVSLMALTDEAYRGKIIIEQPGLSSPGTQLLLWSHLALGQDRETEFWTKLKANVLTVAPDWSTAYGQFTSGEAPIVLSYLTSPAYHLDQEGSDRYQAIPITEGYLRQIEGVGVVRGNGQTALARAFVDYLIAPEVQSKIPTTQWMFPVLTGVTLPDAFNQIIWPKTEQILTPTSDNITADFPRWWQEWNIRFGIL